MIQKRTAQDTSRYKVLKMGVYVAAVITLLIGQTLSLPYEYEHHHRHNRHHHNDHEPVYAIPLQPYVLPYIQQNPYNQHDASEHYFYRKPAFQEQMERELFANLPYGDPQPFSQLEDFGNQQHQGVQSAHEYFGQTDPGYESFGQYYSSHNRGLTHKRNNGIAFEEQGHVQIRRTTRGNSHHHHHQQQQQDIFGKQYVNSQFEKQKAVNNDQNEDTEQFVQTPDVEFGVQQESDTQHEFQQLNNFGQQKEEEPGQQSEDFGQQSDLEFGQLTKPTTLSDQQVHNYDGHQYKPDLIFPSQQQQQQQQEKETELQKQTDNFLQNEKHDSDTEFNIPTDQLEQQQQSDIYFGTNNPSKPGKLTEQTEQQNDDLVQQYQTDGGDLGFGQTDGGDLGLGSDNQHDTGKLTDQLQQQTEEFGEQQQSDLGFGFNNPSKPGKLTEQTGQQTEEFGQQYQSQDEQQTGELTDQLGQQTEEFGQQHQSDLEFGSNKPPKPGKLTEQPGQQTEDFGQQYQSEDGFGPENQQQTGKLTDQLGQQTEEFGQQQQSDLEFGSNKPPKPGKLTEQPTEDLGQQYQSQDEFGQQQDIFEFGTQEPQETGHVFSQQQFDDEGTFSQQQQHDVSVHQKQSEKDYNKLVDSVLQLEADVTGMLNSADGNQQTETIHEPNANNENTPNQDQQSQLVQAFGYIPKHDEQDSDQQETLDKSSDEEDLKEDNNKSHEENSQEEETPSFWKRMRTGIRSKVNTAYQKVKDKAKALADKVKDSISDDE